jgi:hypothetical protein
MAKWLVTRRRFAFTRKVLWIAVVAVFLLGGWALAQCFQCPYLQLNTSNVMGMMPPNSCQGCRTRGITIVQQKTKKGPAYTYTASADNNGAYVVTRQGTPWVTVTYNKSTGLFEVTDPNGTGSPVLKLGDPRSAGGNQSTQ